MVSIAATLENIKSWLAEARSIGATHMIVKCDSFANDAECCYPMFVLPGENARDKADTNGDRTMECYAMSLDDTLQLNERRAHHWD